MRTEELKIDWNNLTRAFSERFADGEEMDLDAILFIVGVQEVGQGFKRYRKNDKIDLIHVAICRLLEPYGYYEFSGVDEKGWPHYNATATLPFLKAGEQTLLMKEALVQYAKENNWIE